MSIRLLLHSIALAIAVFVGNVSTLVWAEDDIVLSSPNGRLSVNLSFDSDWPVICASYLETKVLLASELGLELEPALKGKLRLVWIDECGKEEVWSPTWGENERIRDAYNGVILTMRESGEDARTIQLGVRAYNEGVAYRFVLPQSQFETKVKVNF